MSRKVRRNGLLDFFSTSTKYSVKKPTATRSSTGNLQYKGHKIWRTPEGEFEVPSIEKGTLFDTVGDAKKFIGYWEKQGQRNPGMKIKGRKVYVSKNEVDKFFRGFPGSTKPKKALWFEFASNGDLVDIGPGNTEKFDGYELSALSQDAQKYLESKQKNPGKGNQSDWIPVHAIRQLPSGDIQLLTERGTMSNPGKRKSFLKKVGKVFGKVVKTVKKKL